MKKNIFCALLLLLATMSGMAQNKKKAKPLAPPPCGCRTGGAYSSIPDPDAAQRVDGFANALIGKINVIGIPNQPTEIKCSAKTFTDLLNKFATVTVSSTSTDLRYNGIRAYFAIDPSTSFLTLLFVPTIDSVENGYPANVDDLGTATSSNCWQIKNDQVVSVAIDDAHKWVAAYGALAMQKLDPDGGTRAYTGFQDTRSIWYDMKFIKRKDGHDLLCYLDNLVCSDPASVVNIQFATYLNDAIWQMLRYHLTLIFNFVSSSNNLAGNKLTTYSLHLVPSMYKRAALSGTSSDTGDPCPPYPAGKNTCPGTLL